VPLASVTGTITSFIGDYGLYAVFLLMFVDAVFPAASELVMVYGGALAAGAFAGQNVTLFGTEISSGLPAYLAIALAGTIGYLLGSIFGWALGYWGGRDFVERRGRWLHLSPKQIARAEGWFQRWQDWAVLVGRVTPLARSFISIPAGIFRTPFARYVVLTAIGSALWAFALAGVGWAAGSSYERVHEDFRYVDYAVLAGIVLLAVYLVLRRRRSSTISRRAEDPAR
jgi:membrane protein DedA with SNARE-associated domain